MSREQFLQVCDLLPGPGRGLYMQGLARHVNGKISLARDKDHVKLPIQLSLKALGAKRNDICGVLLPDAAENDLVPVLCFIDPAKFLETLPTPETITEVLNRHGAVKSREVLAAIDDLLGLPPKRETGLAPAHTAPYGGSDEQT